MRDEGLWVVNRCQWGASVWGFFFVFERSAEEAQAKFVLVVAVIRTAQTLFGITGLKEFVGGALSRV